MRFIGIDAGSVSVKLVVLDEKGNKLSGCYKRHRGHPLRVAYELLSEITGDSSDHTLSITGSAGRLMATALGIGFTNELVAQTHATRKHYPHIKTIFELGGEDSKLIVLGKNGIRDFSMNSVCAAGTGSFLDQQAERLRLSIEEFSELALKSKPARVAGRCSVFAKSDMIHLQQIATPVEDIVAGLCFAVARNFRGSIIRGRSIEQPVSFHGGVAANKGMVRAFKDVFGFEQLFIPEDFALMGALGAALKDMDEGIRKSFDLEKLKAVIESSGYSEGGHSKLVSGGDDFFERHAVQLRNADCGMRIDNSELRNPESKIITAFLGIDIGSISTNLAVIDEQGRLLAKRYLMTAGRPIEAVNQGLREIGDELGDKVAIAGVGTTGSGRYMIADYVGADIVKNEITAQATAAAFIDKNVDTIFEIGGQDSKFISLKDGVIVDFEMNKACAAGTGSFLEEQAEKLNVSVKDEFAEIAFCAQSPCRLGERCTVFMENSLMANLQKGADRDNLLAGLAYSIVQNYINKVVAGKPIGENIFFQGGVAFNKSVVAAFEKHLDRKITVPPNHDVTGAIGMALIAMRHVKNRETSDVKRSTEKTPSPIAVHASRITAFKGFELSRRLYEISSFECKGCPNVCEINKVKIEGETGHLFYGGRCEKYDVRRRQRTEIPNLFEKRQQLLWKTHESYSPKGNRPKIGIPYVFFFHDQLPFWSALLWECGFDVEISPKTNSEVIGIGVESVLSEACFPIKVAHGHIRYLKEKGVDAIFLPSFISTNQPDCEFESGHTCPHTQTIPYVSKVAFEGIRLITFPVNFGRGRHYLLKTVGQALKLYGVKRTTLEDALLKADAAQKEFDSAILKGGDAVLSSLKERAIVIVGRAYNAFDKGVNLEIPEKLANLGVRSIPMDFLPLSNKSIKDSWPHMYWRSGQRILQAARFIKNHDLLYPIYISNFNCGPDSFIAEYFREEIGDKPFLSLEIDEHSADAGAVTRCEAFLDSLGNKRATAQISAIKKKTNGKRFAAEKRVFIPRMCDHAYGIAAGFEYVGISAEVLPESDHKTLELGREYVSGKQCYPCLVTTGDMLKQVLSKDFNPENSIFFMPSGTGPCRFGQYNIFQNLVLKKIGFNDVQLFAPIQDTSFYNDLGIAGEDFVKRSWQGIAAIEMLTKCLHEKRPYEKEFGLTDHVYNKNFVKIYNAVRRQNGSLEKLLEDIKKEFDAVPVYKERKPLIGIIGEIFVRSNRFSNENLVKKIEALGGEVWLASPMEWIYYVNHTSLKHALVMKKLPAIIPLFLKNFIQRKIEHDYSKIFNGSLKTVHEPSTSELIRLAAPYVHSSFEGETILSIGKAVDLARRGAAGIINAMPFGCMPGTIVTALLRGISRDYDIPTISNPYDGTESPSIALQIETLMDQAKARKDDGV